MAEMEGNMLFYGVSGKIGDFVIKKLKSGKQVITRAPKSKNNWAATPKQAVCRKKIKLADDYAEIVLADPKLTAYYQPHVKVDLTVRNLAVRDFMMLPRIVDYTLEREEGTDEIFIKLEFAENKLIYTLVVTLYDDQNKEIYSAAAKPGLLKVYWEFRANHPAMSRLHRVDILARDRAGQTELVSLIPDNKSS
jgi:hypothetical protein